MGWLVSTDADDGKELSITVSSQINVEKLNYKLGQTFLNIYNRINESFWTITFKQILLHSQPFPHYKELIATMGDSKPVSENYTLFVTKTLRTYLEPPYGECNSYSSRTYQPFNASSHMECYRLCIRDFYEKLFNCVPLFIDDSMIESDFLTTNKTLCSFKTLMNFKNLTENQTHIQCTKYCPKDCLTVDYSSVMKSTDIRIGNEFWYNLNESERYYRKSLIWDSTQPMFAYNEESVMSFTDYLVNFGGLIGLWFGTNAKNFIIWLIETQFWIKIWHQN